MNLELGTLALGGFHNQYWWWNHRDYTHDADALTVMKSIEVRLLFTMGARCDCRKRGLVDEGLVKMVFE